MDIPFFSEGKHDTASLRFWPTKTVARWSKAIEFILSFIFKYFSINQVREILSNSEEKQIDILYYKKDGKWEATGSYSLYFFSGWGGALVKSKRKGQRTWKRWLADEKNHIAMSHSSRWAKKRKAKVSGRL